MIDAEKIIDEIGNHISNLSAPLNTHNAIQNILTAYKRDIQQQKAEAQQETTEED